MVACFGAWKQHGEDYRRRVQNNISANHFYLLQLFRKTMASFKQYARLPYKQAVFAWFKRATIDSQREVLQRRNILLTTRKRHALRGLIRVHQRRKQVRRKLQVSLRYTELSLQKKYFTGWKINALLGKLRDRRELRLIKEACRTFMDRLHKLLRSKTISK